MESRATEFRFSISTLAMEKREEERLGTFYHIASLSVESGAPLLFVSPATGVYYYLSVLFRI